MRSVRRLIISSLIGLSVRMTFGRVIYLFVHLFVLSSMYSFVVFFSPFHFLFDWFVHSFTWSSFDPFLKVYVHPYSRSFVPRFSWTFLRPVNHSTIGFNAFHLNLLFHVFYWFDVFYLSLWRLHWFIRYACVHSFIYSSVQWITSIIQSLVISFIHLLLLFIQSVTHLELNSCIVACCYVSLSFLHQLSHYFMLFHSYTRELTHSHIQSWMHLLLHYGI